MDDVLVERHHAVVLGYGHVTISAEEPEGSIVAGAEYNRVYYDVVSVFQYSRVASKSFHARSLYHI